MSNDNKILLDTLFEQMAAEGEKHFQALNAHRISVDLKNTFCPVDLGDWIQLCGNTGVPFIPAAAIAEIPIDVITMFDQPGPHLDQIEAFWQEIKSHVGPSTSGAAPSHIMLRWSCCSCAEVKGRLGEGKHQWDPSLIDQFRIDDVRAFDLICEFPKPTVKAYLRPWKTLDIYKGFPIEFRAFVEDDLIVGVSSYYPQRPLPFTVPIMRYVEKVILYTKALIHGQRLPLNMPEISKTPFDPDKNSWTADFAVTGQEVLFLEGGPPHTAFFGAHPCCFGVNDIEGIALRPRSGAAGDVQQFLEE